MSFSGARSCPTPATDVNHHAPKRPAASFGAAPRRVSQPKQALAPRCGGHVCRAEKHRSGVCVKGMVTGLCLPVKASGLHWHFFWALFPVTHCGKRQLSDADPFSVSTRSLPMSVPMSAALDGQPTKICNVCQAAILAMLTALTATPVSLEFAAFSMSRIWPSRSCASVWPRTLAHSRSAPYRAIS